MQFGFTYENHVRMGLSFIRDQCDMGATQDNRNPLLSKLCSKIVGVERAGCMKRDADKVYRHRRIGWADLFVSVNHSPLRRNERCQIWHGDLLEVQHTRTPYPSNRRGRCSNEQ